MSVALIVLPVFALILAGFIARRCGALGPAATGELNRFVVNLALPALLFDIVAGAQWSDIWRPGFIGAFGLGAAAVFAATVMVRMAGRRGMADASVDGLNAAYANTGFLGFPLALAALGSGMLAPTLIATLITVCVLFAVAIVLIEISLQAERSPAAAARKVALSLARNPLVVAPALGAVFLAAGWAEPTPLHAFLQLLGGAAAPCALVTLGLFLAERTDGPKPAVGDIALLTGLKLLAQPLLTWGLAVFVFRLAPAETHGAVLLALLPTGTGAFMLAQRYGREAALTSRVVLVSTILSVPLIIGWLSWIG
ncbi:AEC family transporter [Brevundimonas sp. FT23028]|uniref:AEC family transporter n=1 Tax=Brevundimonas sp. FT23028 TaxID=3393748 RepID=UPI003B58B011